ncbi:MAG: site-2 protease family protein [Dongiaceae bacterium]
MADDTLFSAIQTLAVIALPTLLAITCHEAAHGIVAYWLGDDTAYRQGRVTLNPVRHIDPFGSILMPLMLYFAAQGSMLFGYAKPVPINASRMRHPRRDMVLVALAGPGMNLLLATISAALGFAEPWIPSLAHDWVGGALWWSLHFNLVIALFNLLPVPPLDGSHLVVSVLPRSLAIRYSKLGRYGILVVLLVFFVLPQAGNLIGVSINPFAWLVLGPAEWLADGIVRIFGLS